MAKSPAKGTERGRQQVFVSPDGSPLRMHKKSISKMDELLLPYVYGAVPQDNVQAYVKSQKDKSVAPVMRKVSRASVTVYDPQPRPWAGILRPGEHSPLCNQCALHNTEPMPASPFFKPVGAASPLITVIVDGVTVDEDRRGVLGTAGSMATLRKMFSTMAQRGDIDINSVRWLPITRCASRGKATNLKIKGNWCRYHVIDDLMRHPPKLIMTVGTQVTGLLSHKSNAQDWGGRVLTYRGWPDDWLTNPFYALPRPNPADPFGKEKIIGHPLFGSAPSTRIPLVPIQSPRMVAWDQNIISLQRLVDHVKLAVRTAKEGWIPPTFLRPWYRFTEDVHEIVAGLNEILRHPGIRLVFDTETTGIRGWTDDAAIVSAMFRWTDPETNKPRSLGFPFDFPQFSDGTVNPVYAHVPALWPRIWKTLCNSTLIGHNLTFDVLYTFSNYLRDWLGKFDDPELNRKRDRFLCQIVDAAKYDTWHMAYVFRQQRERLGLEHMTYRFVKDLAGYEEEMTLLIDLMPNQLHPETRKNGSGAHYLLCPRDKWKTHLVPYVMGDVEATHGTYEALQKRLEQSDRYAIPLAKPGQSGGFRLFETPGRKFVYDNIMSPASQVLIKMMARGMFVDTKKRDKVADELSKSIVAASRKFLQGCAESIDEAHINSTLNLNSILDLDLDSKTQLHTLFFNEHCLDLPVYRLTKKGRQLYGETAMEWRDSISEELYKRYSRMTQQELEAGIRQKLVKFAAIDKFTLNQLAVKHEHVRSLLEYRKLFKLNTAYVQPLLPDDRREAGKPGHLMFDNCVHASFMLTGTRGGRLSCRDPNLQQLPRDGAVKELYTSRFGKRGCLYQADLSQIELRLMAAACGDPTMIDAYFKDIDLHSLTASRIFDTPYEHFTKDYMKSLQSKGKDDEAKLLDLNRTTAKCVDLLTLVSVDGRIERIGNLNEGRAEDTFYPITGRKVQGPYGRVPIKNFYSNGIKDRLLICSRRGLVVCSLEHPFLLRSGALKKAKDIRVGDELADAVSLESDALKPLVPFCPFGSQAGSDKHFQIHVDGDLAYLLGLFYGDGCSNIGEVSISTGGTPEFFDWQDIIAEAVTKAGFEPSITRTAWSSEQSGPKVIKTGPSAGQEIHGASGLVNFGSTRISDIFVQLGAVENTAKRERTLRLPLWLLNAPYDVKVEFLAGWLDSDGHCPRAGSLSGITKSWVLAQDLMVLLDSIHVNYAFEPNWNRTYKRFYFRINLSVESSWAHFSDRLRHPKKRKLLRKPKRVYKHKRPNLVQQVIKLSPAHLVDLEVDTSDHLFICNSATCRNTVNFLTGYGGGAFGLQNVLAMKGIFKEQEECQNIIELFFNSYPSLRSLLQYYKRFILDNLCAVSVFGRVRFFEEAKSEDGEQQSKALRAGCNHLIQSTASDMMLIALFVIENWMRDEQLESILVSTVHDSLVIDAIREELPKVHEIVDTVLNNFPVVLRSVFGDDYNTDWMLVPFAGDSEVGHDYLHMKKVPKKNVDWDELLTQKEKANE